MSQHDLLRWTFGDEERPELRAGRSRRPSVWRGVLLAVGFVVAFGSAGMGGYVLGRYQQVHEMAQADLQSVIDLEGWAWQQGDRNLWQSVLDPAAPAEWRSEIQQQFNTAVHAARRVSIEGLSLRGEVARVDVKVVEGGNSHREVRYYRLVAGQWHRTAPG